jgi:hypothetical protein
MGAAVQLHVAEVHQAPVKKRRPKRTGGGNGPEFARFAHRIYQDERAGQESRTLLLAVAYAVTMAPLDEDETVWTATQKALGTGRRTHRGTLRELVRADVPRYEPPGHRYGSDPMDQVCTGPRMRPAPGGDDDIRNTMNICGARANDKVTEKMPDTGWYKNHWFCPRHRDHLERVRAQVKAQNERAPKPIPNRGGLLPVYFDADWLAVYRWAYDIDTWEPPVYGLCADDWPVPGRDTERIRMLQTKPRFRIIFGGADLTNLTTTETDEPS